MTDEPDTKTQRDRRKFSLDDKRRLSELWQASGLSKHKFCEQNDLVLSALTRWCNKFLGQEETKNINWAPVVASNKSNDSVELIEVLLPNKIILRVPLDLSYLKTLLQELYYATTAIR
jgi:hypothetical protein